MKRRSLIHIGVGVLCCCLAAGAAEGQVIRYVDPQAQGSNNGQSWSNAYEDLQYALDQAESLGVPVELHVARDVYRPTSDTNQGAYFRLRDDVAVLGGYAGSGAPNPDLRDPNPLTNETVLSGDIGDVGDSSDNSYVIVKSLGNDATAKLDGFSVTGAVDHAVSCNGGSPILSNLLIHSNQSPNGGAGLLLAANSDPTVTACTFYANASSGEGGAVKVDQNCDPEFTDSLFVANECNDRGGAVSSADPSSNVRTLTFRRCTFLSNRCWGSSRSGGAIRSASALIVRDCIFDGNVAELGGGGAISGDGTGSASLVQVFTSRFTRNVARNNQSGGAIKVGDAPVQIVNCVFESNTAPAGKGGAVFDGTGTGGPGFTGFNYPLTLVNCLFHGNGASLGGGLYSDGRAQTASAIVNCTVVQNYATDSGAGAYLSSPTQKPAITNCIAWDNHVGASVNETAQIGWSGGSTPTVTYTFIQNKTNLIGTGNLGASPNNDPLLVSPSSGNYRLQTSSLCRNAGSTPALPDDFADLDGDNVTNEQTPKDLPLLTRVIDSSVDMGAYEYQAAIVDCNGNGIPDACDISCGNTGCSGIPGCGQSQDCNDNDRPDECDIACGGGHTCDGEPGSYDNNHDGIPDDCQLTADCNLNGIDDTSDINAGTSHDDNDNGIPDECEFPQPRTWTGDAISPTQVDFDLGTLINVNHQAAEGKLQRNPIQKTGSVDGTWPLPYIWVAASGRGTIVRINTDSGKIEGEYWTTPADCSRNPSRTTVDLDASCFVANRDDNWTDPADSQTKGSVTKIGLVIGGQRVNAQGVADSEGEYLAPPFDYCTCEDRDADGRIHTSKGAFDVLSWPNASGVDTNGGVDTAEDECIIRYVRTAGTGLRTIAVDSNNDIWLGGKTNRKHEHRNGEGTNERFGDPVVPAGDWGGYGGLVAHAREIVEGQPVWHEFLWSAGEDGDLLRLDTYDRTVAHTNTLGNYGLGFDPLTARVWHSLSFEPYQLYEIDPLNLTAAWHAYDQDFEDLAWPGPAKGMAVSNNGDVWLAELDGDEVLHYASPGAQYPSTPHASPERIWPDDTEGFSGTTGVAVDRQQCVWITERGYYPDYSVHRVSRYNPVTETVDLRVDLGFNARPYNYSDMTGLVGLHTSGTGTWEVVHDSHQDGTAWCQVRWNEESACSQEPAAGTSLEVSVRAADIEGQLPLEDYLLVQTSGETLSNNIVGRFIEVRVRFHGTYPHPDVTFATPSLCDLTVVPVPSCLKGDVNGDGSVTIADVAPFVAVALENPVYAVLICPADMNKDEVVDGLDVQCFVEKLISGSSSCDSSSGCGGPRGAWSSDCNGNGIPDARDLQNGAPDCNHNGILDECDLDPNDPDGNELVSSDVNTNGIPDECEPDCNKNGVPDDWDIAQQTSADIDSNGVPDECQPDCNHNSVPDYWDVDPNDPDGNNLVSTDCDGNGVPDECQIDCNDNGVPDVCDIDPNDPDGDEVVWPDCNGNHRPDACDFNWPPPFGSLDCNENGIPDECDIANCPENDPSCQDCNENGFPDSCDIAAEISLDENENGIPDECEGEGMMGGGMMQQESLFFGDREARRTAWTEYYDWVRQQDWGPNSSATSAEQFRAMADKLRELGLPVRNPWAE